MTREQRTALILPAIVAVLILLSEAPRAGWSLIGVALVFVLARRAVRVWWFPMVPCGHCQGSWLCRWCGGLGERFRWEIRVVRWVRQWHAQRNERAR
jgi:hypothetical protein